MSSVVVPSLIVAQHGLFVCYHFTHFQERRIHLFILDFFPSRLVNGFLDKSCKEAKVSISQAAEAIGIPRILVDIRHGE